jgi:hypothetical protein
MRSRRLSLPPCAAGVPFRQHDPRWYRQPVAAVMSQGPASPLPRPRCALTPAQRRQGGLTRAVRLTPLERSIAAMRAARARWASSRWASPAARQQIGQALLRARRTPTPRRDRVPLIPAKPPPPRVWHPSMTPAACEVCGHAEALPYQRARLLTCNWVWRCARHAYTRRGDQ